MSTAAILRFVVGFGGAAISLTAPFVIQPMWLALLCLIVGFILSSVLSEFLWRRFASASQVKADLADRTRNPPS